MMNEFFRKEIILSVCISLLFLIIGSLEPTKSRAVTVNDSNNSEPNCYYQNASGVKLNLDSLCGNNQHKKSILLLKNLELANESPLTIKNVQLIIEQGKNDRKEFVGGFITNNSDRVQRFTQVIFEGYTKINGDLKITESHEDFTDNKYLEPGETTTFRSEIKNSLNVLKISYLDSVESHSIPINICYAGSVESKELCKRLNPRYIEELNGKFITSK